MKDIYFVGTTLKDLKSFPDQAKRDAGYQLNKIQEGLDPSDWKPFQSIGASVREIRIHQLDEFRIIYIAKFEDAVYALHAFKKKTQKTEQKDIDLAKARLKEVIHERTNQSKR